jgi:hypothetical protein
MPAHCGLCMMLSALQANIHCVCLLTTYKEGANLEMKTLDGTIQLYSKRYTVQQSRAW